jgi:hypothetical protein
MAINFVDLEGRRTLIEQLGLRTRLAVWLRPTQQHAGELVSKIGGQIAWPTNASWPSCHTPEPGIPPNSEHNDNYVPLAQFLRSDFPQISFPAKSDVLQLLWCPRFHGHPAHPRWHAGPEIQAFWHSWEGLEQHSNPIASQANPFLVPHECTFSPLAIDDTKDWLELQDDEQHRVQGLFCNDQTGSTEPIGVRYAQTLGPIPGTKLLGYPGWNNPEPYPTCAKGHVMCHLFTTGSVEVDPSFGDWYWRYDASFKDLAVHRSVDPVGLDALDGFVHIFYCDVCPDRPIHSLIQSG